MTLRTTTLLASAKNLKEIVIALLGGVGLYVSKVLAAWPGQLMLLFFLVAFIALIVRSILKDEKKKARAKEVMTVAAALSFFCFIGLLVRWYSTSSDSKNTLVNVMTEDAVIADSRNIYWVTEDKLKEGGVCYLATKKVIQNLSDHDSAMLDLLVSKYFSIYIAKGELPNQSVVLHNKIPGNEYTLIIIDKNYLKGKLPPDYQILPSAVSLCVLGEKKLSAGQWREAKELFHKAEEAGSAYAMFRRAQLYEGGYDLAPDADSEQTARDLKKKAADQGYQLAQYEWGKDVLMDDKSSRTEKATAEEYLKKATKLTDARNNVSINTCRDAAGQLLYYYQVRRKDVLQSYILTRRLCRDYPEFSFPKREHIPNCIAMHRYRRAKQLIREFEALPRDSIYKETLEYVFIDHARMYIEGKGVKKNLAEGERLLRYAADSLDFLPAWHELSEFYSRQGYQEEAEYCRRLFDMGYTNQLKAK